jgi:tetratricopeptide (TPR) repeat protein
MIGEKDQSYASTLLNLAMLDEKTGKLNLALEKSEQAVFIFKNTVGEYHSLYASALNSLAILNHQIGQLEKARDIYQ